jgi:hypothetical protein
MGEPDFFYSKSDDVFLFKYLYRSWNVGDNKVYVRTKDNRLVVTTKDFILTCEDGTIVLTDMEGQSLDFTYQDNKITTGSHVIILSESKTQCDGISMILLLFIMLKRIKPSMK